MFRQRAAIIRLMGSFRFAHSSAFLQSRWQHIGNATLADSKLIGGTDLKFLSSTLSKSTLAAGKQPGKGDCPKEAVTKCAKTPKKEEKCKKDSAFLTISKRLFSMIPGKGDCRKKQSAACGKCRPPKKSSDIGGKCCPHPPPKCASVCRGCVPENKPRCPAPTRPPQPCHCPLELEVKHKPGHCPGPCPTKQDDC